MRLHAATTMRPHEKADFVMHATLDSVYFVMHATLDSVNCPFELQAGGFFYDEESAETILHFTISSHRGVRLRNE